MELSDQRHLEAAQGWLGLGNWREANEELEHISPRMRAHPDVLDIRWSVYAAARKWDVALDIAATLVRSVPERLEGWTHRSFCLHELKRTKEAREHLLPAVNKFPDEYVIRYNLACYACQLGDLKEAFQWLEKAIDIASKDDIRQMALDDPDLEPLWNEIGEI
jgi:tetratricopeptide (TPR) repeat protein